MNMEAASFQMHSAGVSHRPRSRFDMRTRPHLGGRFNRKKMELHSRQNGMGAPSSLFRERPASSFCHSSYAPGSSAAISNETASPPTEIADVNQCPRETYEARRVAVCPSKSLFVYRHFLNKRTFDISERSAKRFLKLILGIRQPRFCFHQILTFSPPESDAKAAKAQLGRLLDNLHHRFNMASIYVEELQRKGGIHYHVLFLIFDGAELPAAPTHVERTLRSAVFSAWNAQQYGRLVQCANRLFAWKMKPDYFVKQARLLPFDMPKGRPEKRWWGCRNRNLIRENSIAISPEEIRAEYTRLFVRPSRAALDAKGQSLHANVGERFRRFAE